MKYSIPSEPPVGSKVVSKDGVVWSRTLEGFHANWSRDDTPAMFATWYQLVNLGVEDYIENGSVEQKYEDDDFFGEIRIYIDGEWHHFFWNTITKRFQRMDTDTAGADPQDKREWRSVNAYS